MYNLEDYEKLKNEEINVPKKKFFSKKIFMILGVFIFSVIIVGTSLTTVLGDLNNSINKFKGYVEYLFEDYNVSEIVTDPIYAKDFVDFIDKSNYAGFNVMNNGKVDIEREDLKVDKKVRFTDNEYGAFLSNAINSTDNSVNKIITVSQFDTSVNSEGLVTIKTVYKLDLSSAKSFLELTLGNIPTNIYITVTTKTIGTSIAINTIKVNNLNEEKNEKVIELINQMFGNANNITFADNLANLVFNLNNKISEKAQVEIAYANGFVDYNLI